MKSLLSVLALLAAGLTGPLLYSQSVAGESSLPLVKIVATGGTIANTPGGRIILALLPSKSRH